jgi:Major capsid protein Gp23
MATKIFRRLNDASIKETWAPVLEGYGADIKSRPWLVDLAHNHAIFDNAGSINESQAAPGLFLQQPGSISAMGAISAPTSSMTPFTTAGAKNGYGAGVSGSGDKFPSLLPVAIQVAAKTIGFDLVGVVPMDSPVGFLPYLDYVYQGGNIDKQYEPYLIKIKGLTISTAFVAGSNYGVNNGSDDLVMQYVGDSRVDGLPIFKIINAAEAGSLTGTYFVAGGGNVDIAGPFSSTTTVSGSTVATWVDGTSSVELVSALENHISGFTSVSDDNYATTDFDGPFLGTTGSQSNFFGMKREEAEVSKFRQMGLRMFTKFIEAKGDQVAISATVEQIQDLNRVWNFDVISMLENVAVNELAQSINKKLVDRVFKLGAVHKTNVEAIEGANLCNLDLTVGATGFENISTLQRRVVTKILEMANLIYHRGRFGAGTYIVTNGRVASALADVAGYSFAPFNNDLPSTPGQLYPAGKVHGLTIYVDPNLKFSDDRIHIGRKGADEEPGVKFLPYIMAESLQTIAEGTFSPKIGMKSRYAITEAGWHPETQYITMNVTGLAVLTGTTKPSSSY